MPKIKKYNTGDTVPETGAYVTVCDSQSVTLQQGEAYPPCPACHMAASWRLETLPDIEPIGQTRPSWRTLIRIIGVDAESGMVSLVVPAWNPKQVVSVNQEGIPISVLDAIKPGKRLHAHANLAAEQAEQLRLTSWELD